MELGTVMEQYVTRTPRCGRENDRILMECNRGIKHKHTYVAKRILFTLLG